MRTNARKLFDDPRAPKPLHDPATMAPGQLFRHLHRERTNAGVTIKRKVSIVISSSLQSQLALEFKVKPAQENTSLSAEVMRARRSVDEVDEQLMAKTEEKLFESRSLGREAEGG